MTYRINVLSLTHNGKDWLANSNHPRILHIFDGVCNLINERREILSLVSPQVGNGPFNLVLEEDILFSRYLSLESQVFASSTLLQLGDFTIQTVNANLWFPSPGWETLYAKRAEI